MYFFSCHIQKRTHTHTFCPVQWQNVTGNPNVGGFRVAVMSPSTTRSSSTTTITTDLIYYFSKGRRDIVGYPEIKLWTAQRRVTWRQATRLGHWSCALAPHTIIATITIAMGLIPRCLPWLFGLSRPWPCPTAPLASPLPAPTHTPPIRRLTFLFAIPLSHI